MTLECPAACCPHDGITSDGCPDDLPQAPLPERAAHLYTCQMLSVRKIAAITGADRLCISRLLHEAGITVVPSGTGRSRTRRTAEAARLDQLMAHLYVDQRIPSTKIAEMAGIPDHAVLRRLRRLGITIRTRGCNNREDRTVISGDDLLALYVQGGLSSDEAGSMLGVSRKIVLRSAHDQGLPVRVGGAPPTRGPSEIELLTALYADPQVRSVLQRYDIPAVPHAGPIWERFPEPQQLTAALVTDLYDGCGLSLYHIEMLTGRPTATARALLNATGIPLRPAGGRSPFMRRWRQGEQ